VSGNFRVQNTPLNFGLKLNTGEIDLIGYRNGDLKIFGNNQNTGNFEMQKEIGLTVAGFGGDYRAIHYRNLETNERFTNVERNFYTPISTSTISENNQLANKSYSNSLSINFKLSFFIGIEAGFSIPMGTSYMLPPGNFEEKIKDNTTVNKPIIDLEIVE